MTRLTIPEFAPTEAFVLRSKQGFTSPASRFLNSRRLKPNLTSLSSVEFTRLTIPEFAPTEANLAVKERLNGYSASRFLNSRRLKLTPAASLIFRRDSLLLASDKASQLFK